jgi:hypothetical protein
MNQEKKLKRIAKPSTVIFQKSEEVETPLVSDISIQRLIDDSLLILYREIKQLLFLSSKGKLQPENARDLRDHLKLLFELKNRESEILASMSDEQLEQMLKKDEANETNTSTNSDIK